MLKFMRLDLPASFRITGFRSQALALRDFVQGQYLDDLANLADQREAAAAVKNEETVEAADDDLQQLIVRPTRLPWYP